MNALILSLRESSGSRDERELRQDLILEQRIRRNTWKIFAKETTRETKLEDTFSTGNVHRMDKRGERHLEMQGELQEDMEVSCGFT